MAAERGTITLNFPVQVKSITSDCLSQTVTTSGQYMTSTSPKNYIFTCELEEGYKISGIDFTDGTGGYNSLSGFTDKTFTISISGSSGIISTVGINVSEVQKSISLDNLARFKANCDQTYAKVGEGGGITQSTVIERPESLPTATADSPDFVEVDGVLYRKKAVEGGSLLGTWVFNDIPSLTGFSTGDNVFSINFTSNGTEYTYLTVYGGSSSFDPNKYIQYGSGSSSNIAFSASEASWTNPAYKTIQITDISSLTNEAEFTTWLTANATKQGGGASVSYEYVAQQDAGEGGGGGNKYAHNIYYGNANDGSYLDSYLVTTIILETATPLTKAQMSSLFGSPDGTRYLYSGMLNNDSPRVENALGKAQMSSTGTFSGVYSATYAGATSACGGSDMADYFEDVVVDLSALGIS